MTGIDINAINKTYAIVLPIFSKTGMAFSLLSPSD
jgi:hypothetical protein